MKHLTLIWLAAGLLSAAACTVPGVSYPPSSPWLPGNEYFVFVDGVHGSPAGDGTKEFPLDDVQDGITTAAAAGKDVCVAKGNYAFTYVLEMVEGVSLYGAYENNNGVWTRDFLKNTTSLANVSFGQPGNVTVNCGSTLTRTTVLEGFTINGSCNDSGLAVAVFISGSPTIASNDIVGWTGSPADVQETRAVYCDSPGFAIPDPHLEGNFIVGGFARTATYSLYFSHADGLIEDNIIHGNTSIASGPQTSCGIYLDHANPRLEGNIINGGNMSTFAKGVSCAEGSAPEIVDNHITGGDSDNWNAAVILSESSPLIDSNFINGGTGSSASSAFCISVGMDSYPEITGNELQCTGGGDRRGIYEATTTGDPAHVVSNVFHTSLLAGPVSGYYYTQVLATFTYHASTIVDVNALDENGYNAPFTVYGNTEN
ncbi:MAG TPA: hypothetical protein ENN69_03040 [Spirochaetia bacterium]|nr:hypothetical protein [Spirochaetia bacterium]